MLGNMSLLTLTSVFTVIEVVKHVRQDRLIVLHAKTSQVSCTIFMRQMIKTYVWLYALKDIMEMPALTNVLSVIQDARNVLLLIMTHVPLVKRMMMIWVIS